MKVRHGGKHLGCTVCMPYVHVQIYSEFGQVNRANECRVPESADENDGAGRRGKDCEGQCLAIDVS